MIAQILSLYKFWPSSTNCNTSIWGIFEVYLFFQQMTTNKFKDPNLAAAWGGWVMTPDGQMTRQPIVYHKSVLYPPNPNAVAPTLRDKPPGCRTIFIGNILKFIIGTYLLSY